MNLLNRTKKTYFTFIHHILFNIFARVSWLHVLFKGLSNNLDAQNVDFSPSNANLKSCISRACFTCLLLLLLVVVVVVVVVCTHIDIE